jgi:cadmium resistance protein CadD (predicted permease)
MMREPNQRPETQAQKFLKFFNLFMTLVYPALGLYILLSSPDQIALDKTTKIILGIILICYGIFRFMRTYNRYFRKNQPGNYD